MTKAEIFAILITIIRINENTEPSTLYSFQRADGRCKSAKDNLEVPVRLRALSK